MKITINPNIKDELVIIPATTENTAKAVRLCDASRKRLFQALKGEVEFRIRLARENAAK